MSKTVLVAPLDWGLGHATRCIPIIERLLAKGAGVVLAGHGPSLSLLSQRFPELPAEPLPSYNIRYGRSGRLGLTLALQIPKILSAMRAEHARLTELAEAYQLDICISDNRYGLWNRRLKSVFMCHQLSILPPSPFHWGRPVVYALHRRFMDRFDHCWIPDLPGAGGLGGTLSHPRNLPAHARYIGLLSRFEDSDPSPNSNTASGLLAILSGPEPQRTLLEEKITEQASRINDQVTLILGRPDTSIYQESENLVRISHLDAKSFAKALQTASFVLSRPGYSSLMDYATLGLKKMIWVPTPGQTEQEYLADLHGKNKVAVVQRQDRLDLRKALADTPQTCGFPPFEKNILLDLAINELL